MKAFFLLAIALAVFGCKSSPTGPNNSTQTKDSLAYVFEWDGRAAIAPNYFVDGDVTSHHPKLYVYGDSVGNHTAFVRRQHEVLSGDSTKTITDSSRVTTFTITNGNWHIEWINKTAANNGQTNEDAFIFDGQLVDSANTTMKQVYPKDAWVTNSPPYLQGLFKSPGPRSVIGTTSEVEIIWFKR